MVDWLKYVVRLAAAGVLVLAGTVFVVIAIADPKGRMLAGSIASVLVLGGVFAWPRRPNAWRGDRPTSKQMAFARDLGISFPRRITKGELSDLIEHAKAVRDAF